MVWLIREPVMVSKEGAKPWKLERGFQTEGKKNFF
jgi:hypothetical protein